MYREASRVVLVPFHDAEPAGSGAEVDDADLIAVQERAGIAVCLFIKLGKVFYSCKAFRNSIDTEVGQIFQRNGVVVENRIRRTYTILLFFTLKVGCFI